MIQFTKRKTDVKLIDQIITRFEEIAPEIYDVQDRMSWIMDLSACNANGCELNLDALLSAPAFDLIHDIAGIRKNINRKTGLLENCFVPRYARQH